MKKKLTHLAIAFLLLEVFPAQKIDPNAMPKPGPTPVVNIANPKTFQLSNGLTVIVMENNKLPKVSAELLIDRPPYYEGALAGVTQIMAAQFKNGSINHTKEEFNKRIDFLGANLSFASNGASVGSLSKYFPEVLGLMADAVINPNFSSEEIKNSKNRAIESLKSNDKNASSIVSRVANALQYGKETSRGQFITFESINKIELVDVQNIYKKYYTPDNAYLVIVGDVKYEQIKSLVEKQFSGWKKSDTVFAPLEPDLNVDKTEINIVDLPSAVQSIIYVSNTIILKKRDHMYFPANIVNHILGGSFSSRLNMNLREKNGYTYGTGSSLNMDKYSPNFSAVASVRNEVTDKAVKEIVNELKTINTITPEELENAKAIVKGGFIRSLEDPKNVALMALEQKVQNLPADFYSNYLKSIDKVTIADISNAIKYTTLPDQSRIIVVGKAEDISADLEKLGYPVKYFDKEANPVKK